MPGDLGRMAMFADPSGATFSIWQPIAHIGAEVVGDSGAVVWNELTTRHVAEAIAFYSAVFGWTFADSAFGGPYQEITCDGHTVGGLMPMEGEMWEGIPDHWMVYFAADDPDAVAAKAIELGGAAPVPPQDIPPGRFAVLNDPAGAHFSILRPTPPPA